MPKNLMDEDFVEVDSLKDRYKKQNELLLKHERISAFDSEIKDFFNRNLKDYDWAVEYKKFYNLKVEENKDILKECINEKLFVDLNNKADLVIKKHDADVAEAKRVKALKEAEALRAAEELKKAEEKRKIEEAKRKQAEEERMMAELARKKEEEELRKKAEDEKREAERKAKLERERKEKEEAARIERENYKKQVKDFDAAIKTLNEKTPSKFWAENILDLEKEVAKIPAAYRVEFDNLDVLENLVIKANKYKKELECDQKLKELDSRSSKDEKYLDSYLREIESIQALEPEFIFDNAKLKSLAKDAVYEVYKYKIMELKDILSATPSIELVEKFDEANKTIVKPKKFDPEDYITGFKKKWSSLNSSLASYREKIKADKEKAKAKAKKDAEKAEKKRQRSKKLTDVKEKLTSRKAIAIIISLFSLAVAIAGAVVGTLFLGSVIPDLWWLVVAGIVCLGIFGTFFLQRGTCLFVCTLLALLALGTISFIPMTWFIGAGGLAGLLIALFTQYRRDGYRTLRSYETYRGKQRVAVHEAEQFSFANSLYVCIAAILLSISLPIFLLDGILMYVPAAATLCGTLVFFDWYHIHVLDENYNPAWPVAIFSVILGLLSIGMLSVAIARLDDVLFGLSIIYAGAFIALVFDGIYFYVCFYEGSYALYALFSLLVVGAAYIFFGANHYEPSEEVAEAARLLIGMLIK